MELGNTVGEEGPGLLRPSRMSGIQSTAVFGGFGSYPCVSDSIEECMRTGEITFQMPFIPISGCSLTLTLSAMER